jgi:hypothetical protein
MLFVFKRRAAFELSYNGSKQRRAAHVLNQKNAVFAYYTNFLKFEYGKYQVHSSQMLGENLKEYEDYRHVTASIDSVRSLMYETQDEIERFIREKKIGGVDSSLERYAKNFDWEAQKRAYAELSERKDKAGQIMAALDARHEKVWGLLTRLRANRTLAQPILDNITQAYMDEVGRLITEVSV